MGLDCDFDLPLKFWHDAGKEIDNPLVLADVGDLHVQEIRACGVDDSRLMDIVCESVKIVMEEVSYASL